MPGSVRTLLALLLEALRGADDSVVDRLGALASWQGLMALADAGWLASGRGSVRYAAVEMRARLREIAAARRALASIERAAHGETICVTGEVTGSSGVDVAVVSDDAGASVLVDLTGARVVPQRPLSSGEQVTVVGFADSAPDAALTAISSRSLPRRPILRGSGATQLVVLRARRAAEG